MIELDESMVQKSIIICSLRCIVFGTINKTYINNTINVVLKYVGATVPVPVPVVLYVCI